MAKGLNLQNIKNTNRANILYLLNQYGTLSRKQISEYLGLTKAALTKITQQLLLEGVIIEKDIVGSGVGRKEVLLELHFNNNSALAITFERDEITLAICNLNGTLKEIKSIPFSINFDVVKKEITNFYNLYKNQYKLVGCGVSIIGSKKDYGVYKNIDIQKEIETIVDIPVFVKNNVQAFALGEFIYGDKTNEKNMLIFKWGPGIGSSLVREGKVISGDDFGITEIGHMIVNPGGKRCRCGRVGCLETETALDVIHNDALKLGYDLTVDDILTSKDLVLKNLVDHKIDMVCLALLNSCTICSTKYIVLFGSVFKNQAFTNKFIGRWNIIANNLNFNITLSSLNDKASYIGSTSLVARKLFFEKNI